MSDSAVSRLVFDASGAKAGRGSRAFGGALRSLRLDHTDDPAATRNEYHVLTDDEGALIFDQHGQPAPRNKPPAGDPQ